MKIHEKNPFVKLSRIPTITEKKICKKTKDNKEDANTLLHKENIPGAVLSKHRQKRKGPTSPLKQIQVDPVNNKILPNGAENQVVLSPHKSKKNLRKPHPSHKIKKVVTCNEDDVIDSCNKISAEENDINIHQLSLFESPEREDIAKEKSPSKKKRKNIFTEEPASLLIEDDDLIKVLKPVNCYQSPLQLKKFKSRTKRAAADHGKTKSDKEANQQPKKLVSRTKKNREEKQKAKEENEEARNVYEIEKLNQHFSELDKMDLCIE